MDRLQIPGIELELALLFKSINNKYNYDFTHYAPASMKRRVLQAMIRMGHQTVPGLRDTVLKDSESFLDLLQSLTIPVSEMFRDASYFTSLREKVFPILKTYPSLKIWVAGCSTGEEVYSIAILLQEEGLLERTILYGTDINPTSLAKAEKGVFTIEDIKQATTNYQKCGGQHSLSEYYTAAFKAVKFKKYLRDRITFADHSLVTDAVFSETQFISCRNVLIYFDRHLQDRALSLFNDSLCRKGFLGLGNKETIQFSEHAKCFNPFVKEDRLFQKK